MSDHAIGSPHERHETILEEARRIVYGDRQDDYGSVKEDFGRTAALWDVYL